PLPQRPRRRARFNGATDLHRWRPGIRPDAGTGRPSFNGATDLHRWRRRGLISRRERTIGFNGATDLHRWRLTGAEFWIIVDDALQRSHRSSSVETWRGTARHPRLIRASTEPPIFIGGDAV